MYIETINHYVNEGRTVYSCLLDASKAFDRVLWSSGKCIFYLYVYYWIAILDNLLVLHGVSLFFLE